MKSLFPSYPNRKAIRLDGLWDFTFTDDCPDPANPMVGRIRYNDLMTVPAAFDAMPKYAAKRGTAFYRTKVKTTPFAKIMLKSTGLGMWAAFFWDGKRIGIQNLPYSGMEFIFDAGYSDTHELVVVVDNRFDFNRQPLLSQNYDFYCHGGIFRSLELQELPELAIDRVQVKTVDLEKAVVNVTIKFHGTPQPTVVISGNIDDEPEFTRGLDLVDKQASFQITLADKTPWSPQVPKLHTIRIQLGDDEIVERFGLRTIAAQDGQILLNGKPIRLHGVCRHESHPEFGPALPYTTILEDLHLLKQLGCNFVRGTHYPQDQRFLNLCDELGILVWEETLGWGDRQDHLTDQNFQQAQLSQVDWMVKNSFNHPAVILWGFLNEGDSALPEGRELYQKMAEKLHQLDDSRLVTYASMFFTKDINFDLVDVISVNMYPGWYASDNQALRPLAEIRPAIQNFLNFKNGSEDLKDKPFIISEIGAGAIYGWRDRFHAHWSEEYQADYMDEVCTVFTDTPQISGLALWQFHDGRTYSSSMALTRPRAFNNKGLFDEYRRPKLAADVVAKHFKQLP